jgi:hypothetical protein
LTANRALGPDTRYAPSRSMRAISGARNGTTLARPLGTGVPTGDAELSS